MTARLFGTDGVRGVAGEPPLDRTTVTRLGAALAGHLTSAGRPRRILLAGDTRASTPELAAWLGGSFIAAGGEVTWAGVLPTPAVSHLLRTVGGYGAGVVISASHNPAEDNGIKLVAPAGTKWPLAAEHGLERLLGDVGAVAATAPLPAVTPGLAGRFLDILRATLPERPLEGMHVVVDAANGAASPVAADFFASLGCRVDMLADRPDGRNINAGVGALYPEPLAAEVRSLGADAGVALDGDADRAILVTDAGRVLNGDDMLLVWARGLADAGVLDGRTVVATVMSNLALELALRREGIRLVRCPVGDREVWEAMEREGAVLGGEQSGHIICARYAVTGDGLLTAAHLFAAAHSRRRRLDELADLEPFPQVLLNVRVGHRRPLESVPEVLRAVRAAEASLDGRGRVLVRYSGTEPLLRIMVEGPRLEIAEAVANGLAETAVNTLR